MINSRKLMTLDEFTIQELRNFPQATGELSGLLRSIGLACKRINAEVNRAGLADILGAVGVENVQGEEVQRLYQFKEQFEEFERNRIAAKEAKRKGEPTPEENDEVTECH